MKKGKSGFTMIELILVLALMGILASLAIPRLDRDLREEAQTSILNAIRYTQHLALMDNKHMFDNPKWQQRYWQIVFTQCSEGNQWFYMIGSDDNMNGNGYFEKSEAAINGATGLPYFWSTMDSCNNGSDGTVSSDIFISKKYGINSITFKGGCANTQHIGFDRLGRPHINFEDNISPNYSSYMNTNCRITFGFGDTALDPFTITIVKETGYAYLN